MAAAAEEDLAAKFMRFVQKNPLFKRSISNFIEAHCAKFSGDAGDEQRLDQHEVFVEYCELAQRSIDLFISKTKGANEEALIKALHASDADPDPTYAEVVDDLVAMTSYERFAETMRARRAKAMASALDDMGTALAASRSSHK